MQVAVVCYERLFETQSTGKRPELYNAQETPDIAVTKMWNLALACLVRAVYKTTIPQACLHVDTSNSSEAGRTLLKCKVGDGVELALASLLPGTIENVNLDLLFDTYMPPPPLLCDANCLLHAEEAC